MMMNVTMPMFGSITRWTPQDVSEPKQDRDTAIQDSLHNRVLTQFANDLYLSRRSRLKRDQYFSFYSADEKSLIHLENTPGAGNDHATQFDKYFKYLVNGFQTQFSSFPSDASQNLARTIPFDVSQALLKAFENAPDVQNEAILYTVWGDDGVQIQTAVPFLPEQV